MRTMLASVSLFSLSMLTSFTSDATVVYPSEVNSHLYTISSKGTFYLQAGSFKSNKNAQNFRHQISTKTNYPVTIEKHGVYHRVLIGPMQTAAEIKAVNNVVHGAVPVHVANIKSVHVKQQKTTPVVQYQAQSWPVMHEPEAPIHVNVGSRDKDAALLTQGDVDHFDLMGAVGIASFNATNSSLRLSRTEVDTVAPNSGSWNNFTGQLGVGYVHYLPEIWHSDTVHWFPYFEPELNVYYVGSSSIDGDVLQFQNPKLNNLTYSMPINSTRLMIDGALTIASMDQFSIYGKGGLGNAWSRIGYNDTFNGGAERLNLNTRTDSSFVWEAGGGVQYAFNQRIGLSLEYLYTALGTQTVSSHGNGVVNSVVTPGAFHMNTQGVLLGLHVAVE